ncbi:MAG: FeoA family protein [Anaerolineales bacterium]|jgi:Fe2+ transport system protein FeoA
MKFNFWHRRKRRSRQHTHRGRRRAAWQSQDCEENCRECAHRRACTLREVPAGSAAVIRGYLAKMPETRRTQLMAYGLLPGRQVRVCQQLPVTVIQIAFTELALEGELAEAVQVEVD